MSEISCRENVGLLAYSPLAIGYLSGKYRENQIPEKSRIGLFGQFWTRYKEPAAIRATDEYFKLAKESGYIDTNGSSFCKLKTFYDE